MSQAGNLFLTVMSLMKDHVGSVIDVADKTRNMSKKIHCVIIWRC